MAPGASPDARARRRCAALMALMALMAMMALAACDQIREEIGYRKSIPDEFVVVSRRPLEMPPSDALPVPSPDASGPGDIDPVADARAALWGEAARQERAAGGFSAGERALLAAARAQEPVPGIRRLVNAETRAMEEDAGRLADSLFFWREPTGPETVLRPQVEGGREPGVTEPGVTESGAQGPGTGPRSSGVSPGAPLGAPPGALSAPLSAPLSGTDAGAR